MKLTRPNVSRGPAMIGGHNPSPCPSPPGRGNPAARSARSFRSCTVAAPSLLPWGEGQDEGRFAQYCAPSSFAGLTRRMLWPRCIKLPAMNSACGTWWKTLIAAGLLALSASAALADDVGCVSTTFRIVGRNDQVCVSAFDDPKVPGVACHISQARTGGLGGSLGLSEDPSRFSISCRQIGPVTADIDSSAITIRSTPSTPRSSSSTPTSSGSWTRSATPSSISRSATS